MKTKHQILFVHQNFPGQFVHLSKFLASLGHEVISLSIHGNTVPGIKQFTYKPKRGNTQGVHPHLVDFETKAIRGEACMNAMLELKSRGLNPSLIVAHPGWGETLFCKNVFPNAKLLHFLEFFYKAEGGDGSFDPEFADLSVQAKARITLKNANNLMALHSMDFGLSPTHWQKSTMPDLYQPKIKVIFDGVDTDWLAPSDSARFQLPNGGPLLDQNSEVVTFINRNLEPYRGYHQFMRCLPGLMRSRPNAQIVIVGEDGVSYGAQPENGKTWRQIFLDEVKDEIDMTRVHYVGRIAHSDLLKLYQLSSCHVYLTYPFVLSWSCVEALAAGCVVVASDTQPVHEFIEHGVNGYLVDFFDPKALANQVVDVLKHRSQQKMISQTARRWATERYDLKTVCLPEQVRYVQRILSA